MPQDNPQLASIAVMVREDRKALFVRHHAGPFRGRWSLPFIGVADQETAEDAIERLLRDFLHVEPGPYEFLDTIYLTGDGGARFIANGFTCIDWTGTPRFPAELFDDALWTLPSEAAGLDLLPEMRDWLAEVFAGPSGTPEAATFDAEDLLEALANARGDLVAAFDAIPVARRSVALDEGGWSPLDVLAHAGEVEAYYRNEVVRCLEQAGRTWRQFNDDEWNDVHRLRPAEDEDALRERLAAVGAQTRSWLTYLPPDTLAAYLDHPERGVVQVGDRIQKIAGHHHAHAGQLRQMAQAAAIQAAADEAAEKDDRL